MFYSQFILAKKGPLGTIWIAAHLERKLRKNQIADTDIGVSVDSILFPDMPIALRLSSHLLLGVVRIYSKQVNYLFDDCSEALLKVKQAFRSAAVDLPPEESTAPYHSITLPETFDLDDFELPDTDIFHGNYVDHHISAKEQITLQDTMEGAVYSTSQFGLDERFGDDDTSRLDLDEELFLEKVTGPIVDGDMPISYVEGQPSNPGLIHLKDEDQEMLTDSPEQPIADAENEVGQFDLDDYAQPPSTPGLLEEPNLSNIQEVSACEDHMEVDDQIIQEQAVEDNLLNATSKWPKDESVLENDCQTSGKEINQLAEFDGIGKDGELVSDLNHHGLDETISTPIFSQHTPVLESCDVTGNPDLSNSVVNDNDASKNSENPENVQNLLLDNVVASNAENLQQNPQNEVASEEIQLEVNETCFPQEPEIACMVEPLSPEKTPAADSSKLDALENVNFDDTDWRSLEMSNISDLPAPETLLSVPEGLSETLEYSMVDFTPNIANTESSNGDGARENLISGKKRTFTESTSVPSLISVESYEPEQSKRTKGSIPDDDDLLSSILGGRIPSVLKMKPTPTPSELTLTKRPRTVARTTASKKRVLMDDSMVLHGDTIRQQLMNTEDIRRQRKKAPCTRREICMIQKDLLEIEIFMEPVLTGLSADFVSLHGQMRDLSKINIYKSVAKKVSSMDEADLQISNDGIELPMEGGPELINSELTGKEIIHTSTVSVNDEEVDLLHASHAEEQMDNCVGVPGPEFTAEEITNTSELDLRGTSISVDEMCPADNGPVSISMDQLPPEATDDTASLQMDTLVMIHEQELKALSFGTNDFDVAEKNGESIMLDNEQKAKDGFFSEGIQADVSIETCWPVEDGEHGLNFNPCLLEENGKEDDKIENINDTVAEELNHNVLNQNPLNFEDEPKIDTAIVVDHDMNMIHEPSKDSECHDGEGFYPSLVADVTPTDCPTMEDNDFNYQDGHDTEFLNVDDDDAFENDDDCIPNGEQAGVMENSGWSSRTRAVAKYLQTAFDKESYQGRKVLAMDNLLVGRTRKEASRMFFEALVLKTKDFIQVEQGVAFNNINITARGKLMKSDF
ncbi:sister chromatid cohesion 1 protein 4-like [Impatiens glandulifera]|uniref:sister chromatid cohesion 1 protein 4-like n=1 Tax=Impatiens glandulifera TaxID=253017 RepID=UPI001FB05744|nr:sister chromatid cohesion 1 protein 4-like [Impatiens glandulifera]XP_047324861.1 sister chromatid cohesion 1 protein 4-like [Impatiens glandulifera]XP_047324862.1 sister chromatid cohesion 1 protein 4-like [Impatiens glandulifera]